MPTSNGSRSPTRRRLGHLAAIIHLESESDVEALCWANSASAEEVALNPELIPFGFQDSLLRGRWANEHLRWMRQKDQLGQDIFLVGMCESRGCSTRRGMIP